MNNVRTNGQLDWSSFIRVPATPELVDKFRLVPGDVLFNNTNSTELVGKTALFRGYDEPIVYSNHFTRLRTIQDALEPEFLALWLQDEWGRGVFAEICNRWIGQSSVKADKLLALETPLPPLSEQRRIAARLNGIMEDIARARGAAQAALDAANATPAALLRLVFGTDEAMRLVCKPISECSTLLPARTISTNGDTEVLAITTACLNEFGFDPLGVKTARMWAKDAAECVVSIGEILVARSNTPGLVGRVSMFQGSPPGAVASDLTIRLLPKTAHYPPYLAGYLSFLFLSGYWKERAGGASGSMKKITRSQLLKVEMPVPRLEDQQRIMNGTEAKMTIARKIRSTAQAQLAAINALPAVYLRRAFNGEV